jgi:hypothetical protein
VELHKSRYHHASHPLSEGYSVGDRGWTSILPNGFELRLSEELRIIGSDKDDTEYSLADRLMTDLNVMQFLMTESLMAIDAEYVNNRNTFDVLTALENKKEIEKHQRV